MNEDAKDPLFTHVEPLVQFRAKDLANALARGGVPYSTASARIQNYSKQNLIHVRGRVGEGKNSPNIYGITDVAAALMLSGLQDCGVADQEVLNIASSALYYWYLGQQARSPHPILAALSDTLDGTEWALQLRFMRHSQTQARYVLRNFGRLDQEAFWAGAENVKDPEWSSVGEVLITTAPLHALRSLIAPPAGMN
ncbi:hypothetical protein [Falsigemmobacter faecalis]|uniref:Uncharacterized protein n=1 Tax=Falsigemmobacter faecalis TaxID=2488730 RepID=A0A3P3D1N5_9RHOB|nr:hypothetical protein [Falsigemmobacter faecalis]RRH68360.1 hypothetical protein EG244_19395 [Falsigemmobacter faecalis]